MRARDRRGASEGECLCIGRISATPQRKLSEISANLGEPLACRGLSDQKGGEGGEGGEDGGGGDAAGEVGRGGGVSAVGGLL